jgi:hypothetical protein
VDFRPRPDDEVRRVFYVGFTREVGAMMGNKTKLEHTNLVTICRGEHVSASVLVGREHTEWLRLGEVQLGRITDRSGELPFWILSAFLARNATDGEHDSAHAIRLPLIGVCLDSVIYHATQILAVVHPGADENQFRVPRPGYDPFINAVRCRDCKGKASHQIVENYLPPYDDELFRIVAGLEVQIVISQDR